MSTRGVVGFRYKRKDLLAYNHSDSYPSYLGNKVVQDFHDQLQKGLKPQIRQVEALTIVTEETPRPDEKEQRRLKKYSNPGVGSPDEYWYRALRETQGDIKAILESRYLLDSGSTILDSLYCEWGYIVNLDDETLEIYKGGQTKPPRLGRYAKRPPSEGYYPCALVQVFDWTEILNDVEAVCAAVVALDVEDEN
jgi:hypothetical protein